METVKMDLPSQYLESTVAGLANRIRMRKMSADEWVENHGSGTLRKNKRIGFRWKGQYLSERVAYEFGHEFETIASSRVTFNDAITYGDCKALTEVGWYAERYFSLNLFPETDVYEVKYIIVEDEDGSRREGVGLVCGQTSAQFIPSGNLLISIFAVWNHEAKTWENVKNPF